MTGTTDAAVAAPVRRSVTVNASVERTFRVFSEGFDSWWPRTHHIGKSPMKKAIVEGKVHADLRWSDARGPRAPSFRTIRRWRRRDAHGRRFGRWMGDVLKLYADRVEQTT
jgi:hypothetical protein